MSKLISFFSEVEIEVEASVTDGFPGRGPSMDHAGGEPAEPREVEDLYVGVIIYGTAIDISDLLTPKQRERMSCECMERVEAEESE